MAERDRHSVYCGIAALPCVVSFLLLNTFVFGFGLYISEIGMDISKSAVVQSLAAQGKGSQYYQKSLKREIKTVLKLSASTQFVIGSWMSLMGLFGILSVLLNMQSVFLIYANLMIATLIILVGAVKAVQHFAFGDFFRECMRGVFVYTLRVEYDCDPYSRSKATRFINRMQVELDCCGMTDYSEYRLAESWRNLTMDGQLIPPSCCHLNKIAFRSKGRYMVNTTACVRTPNKMNSNIDEPCYGKIEKLAMEGGHSLNTLLVSSYIIMAILIFLAYSLIYYKSDALWSCIRKLIR